jgi:transposase InsO family protein
MATMLAEFVRYSNRERPHRSLRLTPPVPIPRSRAGPSAHGQY